MCTQLHKGAPGSPSDALPLLDGDDSVDATSTRKHAMTAIVQGEQAGTGRNWPAVFEPEHHRQMGWQKEEPWPSLNRRPVCGTAGVDFRPARAGGEMLLTMSWRGLLAAVQITVNDDRTNCTPANPELNSHSQPGNPFDCGR
jgi:hypothetical protein